MSIFTPDDVHRLARLARLDLTDEELDVFAQQLGSILEFVRQVEAVDTTSVTAHESATHASAALREDVVRPSLDRDAVLTGAPGADAAAGLFKVPRVLNG